MNEDNKPEKSFLEKRREHIQAGRPLPPKKAYKGIARVSEKRAAKLKEQKEAGGDNEMDLFFEAMRKRMKGVCLFCGGKSEKHNDETYRCSIGHLLPKRPVNQGGFPSVGTVEENWIELCYYQNSCHTNFDSGKITWEFIKDSKEWEIIKEKLLFVLPLVADEERKHKLYSKLTTLVYEGK